MQVWNVVHAACCKYRMQKVVKKSPSEHHHTTLSGYIFATKARIDNRKKVVKQQYLLHMFPQYGELLPTSGWYRSGSLGHPCKFRQPNLAALNRGRHLYLAGRPSRWALAHILVLMVIVISMFTVIFMGISLILLIENICILCSVHPYNFVSVIEC